MAEEFENPLGLQLDENNIATDLLELREIAHHASRGFLEEVIQNPILQLLPTFDYLISFMKYLHDVTCPSNADVGHWVDLQARLDQMDDENAEKALGASAEESSTPLNDLFARQLREILGRKEGE